MKGAPWVRSPGKNIKTILVSVKIPKNSVIYELGCGTGEVIRQLCKDPSTRGIGIDINPLLIFFARTITRLQKMDNITYLVGDIRKYSIIKADVVYLFLMPKMLESLVEKFNKELKSDTLIISLGFPIAGFEKKLQKKISDKPYPIFIYNLGSD